MTSDAFRSHYEDHGWVRLPGAFDPAAAAAMADAVWAELGRRHGARPDDPATWSPSKQRKLGRLREQGAFDAVATPAFTESVTGLAGVADWPRPQHWGQALVTFPERGPWSVPASGWHLDWPARGAPTSRLLVKWLGYVSATVPGGGGTVVIDGSHRLVAELAETLEPGDPGQSKTVRDALFGAHPWFADLRGDDPGRDDRLLAGAVVRGVPVKVVELTGDPGDVVFLHPRLFHAIAPNRSGAPRLMFTGECIRYGS